MAACSPAHVADLADVDAGLATDGLAHGEARPRRREVDRVAAELDLQRADHARRVHRHLLHHVHDVVVVDVGLVGLQHRELGVVLEAHALVAEVLADLVDAVDAADDAALEVQLGGDAQVQVPLQLVVMRDERPRQGAAVQRLQHRRLDLDEAARVQEVADRLDDAGALHEHLARRVVDHEVEEALAVARLHVGESVELLGHGAQRLAQELPGGDAQGELASARAHHHALGADEVAQVDLLDGRVAARTERVDLSEELQLAGRVLDDHERHLAVHATGHDAAGHAVHLGRFLPGLEVLVGVAQRRDLVARLVLGGIRGAGLTPGGELGPPFGEDVAALVGLVLHGRRRSGFFDGQHLEGA